MLQRNKSGFPGVNGKKVEKKPEMQRVNFFGKAQSGELKSFSFEK